MRSAVSRLVAVFVAVVALACSNMGTCWAQIAGTGHECCEEASGPTLRAASNTCGSPAAPAGAPYLPAPSISAAAVSPETPDLALSDDRAFPPAFRVVSPPLVLRI